MDTPQLLDLLFAPVPVDHSGDLRTFLKSCGPGIPATASAFERLVRVALQADNRLLAGAAGHQAAIRRLFPHTPDAAITAFCVSEEHGPQPSKILSTLTPDPAGGFVLNGTKRWGSLSPLADLLYVAASIGQKDGRNQLRMVKVPTDRPGLSLDVAPYSSYQGHMPIADITLNHVAIAADEVIDADGYETFIKPFRLVEDVYNTAATQIGLFRLGRAHGWPQPVLETLLGLIVQAHAIAQTAMATPAEVLLMSAYFRASGQAWDSLADVWAVVPEAERAGWSPQTGTLGVAARARETRRQQAWTALSPLPQ